MLPHEPSHLLAVHEVALVAQLSGDATIAVGLELLADRLDKGEALNISIWGRSAVIGRPSDAHQPASLSDGETAGPAITDIGALLGNRPCCRAPFKNSSSSACRPTIRSSVAILASSGQLPDRQSDGEFAGRLSPKRTTQPLFFSSGLRSVTHG